MYTDHRFRTLVPARLIPLRVVAALVGLMACCVSGTVQADDPPSQTLLHAFSEQHGWVVFLEDETEQSEETEEPKPILYHIHVDQETCWYQPVRKLVRLPEALAADGTDLWLINHSRGDEGNRRREVYHVRGVEHPLHDGVFLLPPDRLDFLPIFSGEGKIAGAAGLDGDLYILLLPQPADLARQAVNPDRLSPVALLIPQLWHFSLGQWSQLDLPEIAPQSRCHLVATDEPGQLWIIESVQATDHLEETSEPPMIQHRFDVRSGWTSERVSSGPGLVVDVVGGAHTPMLIKRNAPDSLQFHQIRSGRTFLLSTFDSPPAPWAIEQQTDLIHIIFGHQSDSLSFIRMDHQTGEVGEATRMDRLPINLAQVLRIPVLLTVAAFGVVMIAVLRPGSRSPIELSDGYRLSGVVERFFALLLDFIPGGVVTILITGGNVSDLLGLPLMTLRFEDSVPYMMMAGISMGLMLIQQLSLGTTYGKHLLGVRVLRESGEKAPRMMIFVRWFIKLVVLMAPPLAIFMVFNPNHQGLHDLIARTVVVSRGTRPQDPS